MTIRELLAMYIKQRRNLPAGSAFAIGHETVITALRKASSQESLAHLEEKRQLNLASLVLYKGERSDWDLAALMRRLLGKRVRLYTRVISQMKETPDFQEAPPPLSNERKPF